jgi:hypothetical protein
MSFSKINDDDDIKPAHPNQAAQKSSEEKKYKKHSSKKINESVQNKIYGNDNGADTNSISSPCKYAAERSDVLKNWNKNFTSRKARRTWARILCLQNPTKESSFFRLLVPGRHALSVCTQHIAFYLQHEIIIPFMCAYMVLLCQSQS